MCFTTEKKFAFIANSEIFLSLDMFWNAPNVVAPIHVEHLVIDCYASELSDLLVEIAKVSLHLTNIIFFF